MSSFKLTANSQISASLLILVQIKKIVSLSILRVCYLDANIRCVFCISALRILYSWVVLLGILLGPARRSFSLLGDYGAQAFLKPCLIVLSKMQSPDCKQKAPQNTPSPPYFQYHSHYFFAFVCVKTQVKEMHLINKCAKTHYSKPKALL